jgi:AAA+ ATPase superfamily predicted ATPase
MEKFAIILYGTQNTGKTSSLKEFVYLLSDNYKNAEIRDDKNNNVELKRSNEGDITVVLNIEGKKIGVCSLGDPDSDQIDKINNLIECGCDIILTASRTKGGTKDDLESTLKNHEFTIIKDSTYFLNNKEENVEEFQNKLNKLKAKHLFDLVREIAGI